MHFGEYELSPSLIGLSLLHSAHPEAFQRLLVRASIPCYRDFTLAKCRSLGFASASADSPPCSGSLSLRLGASSRSTSPATATRRFIMQKARRHPRRGSDRLWAHGFRDYFTPLEGVLFTFPSRYSFTIGLTGVFSLAGWSRPIRAGFHVPRVTQDANGPRRASRTGLSPSTVGLSRRVPLTPRVPPHGPTTPGARKKHAPRFGLFPGRSPLLGESLLFSFPAGTKMFQFPALASAQKVPMAGLQPAGLSHSDTRGSKVICTYPRLIAAYRVLRRLREPRHPPCAFRNFHRCAIPKNGQGALILSAVSYPYRQSAGDNANSCLVLYSFALSQHVKDRVGINPKVENIGVEPMTSCMPCKRSSQLS